MLVTLFPGETIEVVEPGFVENPDERSRKPLGRSVVRAEDALVTVAGLTGGRAYAWMGNVTGITGALLLLFPQRHRTVATALLYEDREVVVWNDRFTGIVRTIGIGYALLTVREGEKRRIAD
ncbi:hypothetical protein [Natronorarus salvus]|uniref:hypothetical protein n=1 Tax=Natronorarus salvus TaxID=3117733 RepID=UPI002F2629F3